MNIIILGAGGVGSYYGTKLLDAGHKVIFIARGKHLKALQQNGLQLIHPEFFFNKNILALDLNELKSKEFSNIDLIILTTKATSTPSIAKELVEIFNKNSYIPYFLSLQNGVENEDILSNYFPKEKIIGGLTRKIGAHIIKSGQIEVTGKVETIIGALEQNTKNEIFVQNLSKELQNSGIFCEVTKDIKLELWKKLIINNGVNAICALLQIKTGILMNNKKLAQIVYGLMRETANAARAVNITISKNDIDSMFDLITKFDSIKPSMLVDRESKRPLEVDEICGVVLKYNSILGLDSPYTKTVSFLLEFIYKNEK